MLSERIKNIRKSLGLSQLEFGKKLGYNSTGTVSQWESGRNDPDYETLIKIADLAAVSIDWLLTGKDRTFSPRITKSIGNTSEATVIDSDYSYPVLAKVLAGDPVAMFDNGNILEMITLKYHRTDGVFLVKVQGDSMDGGKKPIKEGDYLLVDPNEPYYPENVVVIALNDGSYLVKQYNERKEKGKKIIEIISFNPQYPPRYLEESDIVQIFRVKKKYSEDNF